MHAYILVFLQMVVHVLFSLSMYIFVHACLCGSTYTLMYNLSICMSMGVCISMHVCAHTCMYTLLWACVAIGRGVFSVCLLANVVHIKWGSHQAGCRDFYIEVHCPGLSQSSWNYRFFLGWRERFLGVSFLGWTSEQQCSHKEREHHRTGSFMCLNLHPSPAAPRKPKHSVSPRGQTLVLSSGCYQFCGLGLYDFIVPQFVHP